jgi:putative holliday junction resolvase
MKFTTVLGLDFGERRIGIALSDTRRQIATGLTTIDRRRTPDYLKIIDQIIREEDVAQIVVGYPLRTDGKRKPGDKTEIVDAFIAELETRFHLPVAREDEAFTSSLAQDSLRLQGKLQHHKHNKRQREESKAAIDRVAACYILQDWLDRQGERT